MGKGNIIGKPNNPTIDVASGVWSLREQYFAIKDNNWPLPPDPNFSDVELLLHADGSNGSTTFIDSSLNNFTVTAVNGASITTSNFKFGTGSINLDGTNDYLSIPSSSEFDVGSGNWTVEAWVYPTVINGDRAVVIIKRVDNVSDERWIGISIESNLTVRGLVASSSTTWGINTTTTTTVSLNVWTHLAFVRNGTDISMYVGGIKNTLTSSANFSVYMDTAPLLIGMSGTTGGFPYHFQGQIDEIRITKGIARYTANFTPPTSPFSDE